MGVAPRRSPKIVFPLRKSHVISADASESQGRWSGSKS